MLFKRSVLEAIARGEITLAFRRWKRPTVSPGTRLRTAMGELPIGAVRLVSDAQLTQADARKAGFSSLAELKADLRDGAGRSLFRIELGELEPDRRAALRQAAHLSVADAKDIAAQLARWDTINGRPGYHGEILNLIGANSGVPARALAEQLGVEMPTFKRHVRKLKELGLTESQDVGYRLSPRGAALVKRPGG